MIGNAAVMARYEQQIGKIFGSLSFVSVSSKRGDGNRIYGIFECKCGKQIEAAIGRVFAGLRTNCGCMGNKTPGLTHGMRGSPEYQSWTAMKTRCLNPQSKDFPRWGAKGITVCQKWAESFEAFYQHIGPRPPGTSLDRKDNRLGYQPGNVRWATVSEQQRNRAKTYRWHIRGLIFETHNEAADHFKVSGHTVSRWVNGQFDKRRNSFTKPRGDCYVVSRY